MIRIRFINAAGVMLLCASLAHAEDTTVLKQGDQAPAAEVRLLSRSAPLKIGNTSVWPVTNAAPLDQDGIVQPNSTLVVRTSDHVIGLSTNELVVMFPDIAAVGAAASGMAQQVQAFKEIGITVIQVSAFSKLLPLFQALSAKFPAARFDVPVSYAKDEPE